MKTKLTIHEIAKLYNLGVDAIRYYEKKGLIHPIRGANNYRYFTLDDIHVLNMIRDLRELNLSTKHIKKHLESFSVDHAIQLFNHEKARITQEIQKYQNKLQTLEKRTQILHHYSQIDLDCVNVREYPMRYGYQLESHMRTDAEADYTIKQLHRHHHQHLGELADLEVGAIPDYNALKRGIQDTFQSVFFINETNQHNHDFVLDAGQYLSIFYRGSYQQSSDKLAAIITTAQNLGYESNEKPFEIYRIDNRYSQDTSEFLTEIQLLVYTKTQ